MKKSVFKKSTVIFFVSIIVFYIISFCFTLGPDKLTAYFTSFSFSEEFGNKKPLSTKNFESLSSNEKKAYICVLEQIESHPEYIKIPELTQTEFNNVFFAVKNDNPDILCFSDSCNMVSYMSASFLQMNYSYDTDICGKMKEELLAKVKEISQDINTESEYSAELYIHDYIVKNCVYTEDSKNASNAYGCLVENKAVCSGYSRGAMLLLAETGIESMLVGGTGITTENESISHMWNLVWIDGNPYHLDVTWDDPTTTNNATSHMFFNLDTKAISYDHKDITTNIECTYNSANYFVKEKLMYDDYNKNILSDITSRLIENINSGKNYIEIEFSDNSAYQKAVASIIDNSSYASDIYDIIEEISVQTDNNVDTSHINFVKEDSKNYIRLMFDTK